MSVSFDKVYIMTRLQGWFAAVLTATLPRALDAQLAAEWQHAIMCSAA